MSNIFDDLINQKNKENKGKKVYTAEGKINTQELMIDVGEFLISCTINYN